MAARPKLRQLEREIHEAGGEEYIFDRVMDGESVRSIMKDFNVSRGMFYSWLKLRDGRQAAYDAAKKIGGHALAEDAGVLLDELHDEGVYSPAQVSLAKERSKFKVWMAGVLNDEYAPKQKEGTVINIQQLHLNALRNAGDHVEAISAPDPEPEVLEAEVVEDDDDNAAVALLRGTG